MMISEPPIRIILDDNKEYVEEQRRNLYIGRPGHPINSVLLPKSEGEVRPFAFTSNYELIELVNKRVL